MVMSASTPPLAGLSGVAADRNATLDWAVGVIAGSSWHSWCSSAKPSGSREQIMFRCQLAFLSPAGEQPAQ